MNLQNEVSTGETITINESTLSNQLPSFKQQPDVKKTRKTTLIIIGILLSICFINVVFTLLTYATNRSLGGQSAKTITRLLGLLLSIVYYAFGFFVTYRYYRSGLVVFAWLGLVSLLGFAVLIIIALVVAATTTANIGVAEVILGVIVTIISSLIASLLQIFAVRYAFVLSKLLKKIKPLTTEQI